MVANQSSRLRLLRLYLWLGVTAVILLGALVLWIRPQSNERPSAPNTAHASPGGPFTLVGADGKPFSSRMLGGKPYAIYFGFTRCGDICPTTLQRLVRLRRAAGSDDAFNIIFITIDPQHDGPKEVGQYAELFGAPITGLTGSAAQIERVKKSYGIFAQPASHPMPGKEMEHMALVLLFDSRGALTGTIAPGDSDDAALAKLRVSMM